MNLLLAALASMIAHSASRTSHSVDLEIYPVKPAAMVEDSTFSFGAENFLALKSKPVVTLTDVEEFESDDDYRFVWTPEMEQRLQKAAKKLKGRQAAIVRDGQVIAVT